MSRVQRRLPGVRAACRGCLTITRREPSHPRTAVCARVRERPLQVAAFTLFFAVGTGVTSPARAYRTFADDPEVGHAARFRNDTVTWDLSSAPMSLDIAHAVELAAARAFETWTKLECTAAGARIDGAAGLPGVADDERNTITLVETGWEERGFPMDRPATTDVQLVRDGDGWRIAEADVFVDVGHWQWQELGGGAGSLSLRVVLAHEIAHAYGLLHPCEHRAPGVPECGSSEVFRSSIMHPDYGGPGVPSQDDIDGLCSLYPRRSSSCSPGCGESEQCVEGQCESTCRDGSCVSTCETDEDCAGDVCALAGPLAGVCVGAGDRGATCTMGEECGSRLCLRESTGPLSYCTQSCRRDADCGGDETCREVDDEWVCAPAPRASGSCAAGGDTRSPALVSTIAALWLIICAGRRRTKLSLRVKPRRTSNREER